MAAPECPSQPPGGAQTLTDVGGTFSHHVLVVVDAGIWDPGLGLIRRDHKEFLGRRGEWEVVGDEVGIREALGSGVGSGARSVGLGDPWKLWGQNRARGVGGRT